MTAAVADEALARGHEALAAGNWIEARDAFQESLDSTDSPEALDGLGRALWWLRDERGAIVYATFKLLQRDAKLNYMAWEWQDLVEGHLVQLTNPDQSHTFAWIGMHAHKLYIVEGTVPAGYPEPCLFQQSMGWVDKNGNGIRYQSIYSNSYHGMGVYPVPPVAAPGAGR